MDIPQLKVLAGRLRGVLQQSPSQLGHSQALDLIAALLGLRNWPEVIAFPDRVAGCELDAASIGRLAFRLKKNFALELTSKDLLLALAPEVASAPHVPLQVWPGGPPGGVYFTTSREAIGALLGSFETATDGGLVYAERAGNGADGSIDLGEYGLWSQGIDRLPSGTLLVVGPLELDQGSWQEAAERLEIACSHALNSRHRVAVLVSTPTPQTLCQDMVVLLRSSSTERTDIETALAGVVTEDGQLERRDPFASAYPMPRVAVYSDANLEALPASTREVLQLTLAGCSSGIVLFGSSEIAEHSAYDQLASGLALTAGAGPAARIMPRHRGTAAKDWMVPEAIKVLPFLPSIESAYAQGYRRMIVTPHYTRGEMIANYDDVLFLGGTYYFQVADIALKLIAGMGERDADILKRIVVVLGLLEVPSDRGRVVASDLFVRGTSSESVGTEYDQFKAFLQAGRVVRWEEEMASLLNAGAVTEAAVTKASGRHHVVKDFLRGRRKARAGIS